ncbi:ribonuclease HII [Candidatus Omnitrophus magneticus]|uniref:Ribonuclease HII n=1 Tax=Candidatus Omnitrophus magneticus TaxID=1609969 RepID=A0A0F0CIW0_9BACT|nr:ribonuclease HII [Candidatus Omnitrophus magneticus]
MDKKHNIEILLEERFFYEKKAFDEGYSAIAGVDEAGRGPLAGPVVAAATIIHNSIFKQRIDDSKKLTAEKRELAYSEILMNCYIGVGMVGPILIDKFNIYNATLIAMKKAVSRLRITPDYLLIDGKKMNISVPQKRSYIIGGDRKSCSISCASIVAKVIRDKIMDKLAIKYPEYGFAQHRGYGTEEHLNAIIKYGLSPVHRRSFGPFGDMRKQRQKNKTREVEKQYMISEFIYEFNEK